MTQTDVLDALADQQAELRLLIGDLPEPDLLRPTRCDGWTVADVLLHLAQTNEAALASVEGRLDDFLLAGVESTEAGDVDELADLAVQAERHLSPNEIRERWAASADAQLAAFRAADPHARVAWVEGWMAARTLASTRLSETWIHTVDVASAYDIVPAASERLWHIARLAWRTVPYAFVRAGRELQAPVTFLLHAPDGETWTFEASDEDGPVTVVRGPAADLCEVAGQRAAVGDTELTADGPDAAEVLALVRTFA